MSSRLLIIDPDSFGYECARQFAEEGWQVEVASTQDEPGLADLDIGNSEAIEGVRSRVAEKGANILMINLPKWPPVIDFDEPEFEENGEAWGETLAHLAMPGLAIVPLMMSDSGKIVVLTETLPPVEPDSPSSIPVQVAKEALSVLVTELERAGSLRGISVSLVSKDRLQKRGEAPSLHRAVARLRGQLRFD